LFLCIAALAGFFLSIVTGQLLSFDLAELTTQFAAILLLGAFCLLLLAGLIQIGRLIMASVHHYFSSQQRCKRKLLYCLNEYNQLNRLFQLKKDRLAHAHQQQRKRLIINDNRKSAT
jgi:uncharacterized membrane protein YcgQ (UPF0703/DUF1980 family)